MVNNDLQIEIRQALRKNLDELVKEFLDTYPDVQGVLYSPERARNEARERLVKLLGNKLSQIEKIATGERAEDAMAIAGLIAAQVEPARIPISIAVLAVLTLRLLLRRKK